MVQSFQIKTSLSESPRIRLEADDDDDDWVEAAVVFYKGPKFNNEAEVRVHIKGQPGVDTGGIRRQFFSVVFNNLALAKSLKLFEGQPTRLRPAFQSSHLSSGMLRVFGRMVAHSFLLDGQGFSYLSECGYYYLCGSTDAAIATITQADISEQVRTLVEEVQSIDLDTQVATFQRQGELLDLMEQSGCDLPLKEKYKSGINENVILHDALHKRKVYLDSFGEGLEELKVWSLIRNFPEELKPAFVYSGTIDPVQVLEIINPVGDMNDAAQRVFMYLQEFVQESSQTVLVEMLQYITGCSTVKGNSVAVRFTEDEDASAVVVHTCSRELVLSTCISDKSLFKTAMSTIIRENTFTMP